MPQMMLVNPRKRSRKKAKRKAPRRRTTLARARSRKPVRRRRRNPSSRMTLGNVMKGTVMPSFTAAGGAVAVDMALAYLPLPVAMKTGPMRHLVKGVAAIGMGLLAANFVKPKTAELFATGAMTVALYGATKEAIAQFAPQIRMGEYDDLDYYEDAELGFPSPAQVVGTDDELSYYEAQSRDGAYDNYLQD